MKQALKKNITSLLIVFSFGLIPAIIGQFFIPEPVSRHIHVRNFRYGKDPAAIKCNRGDTLYLSFSTEDTGHSFFLEEFDIDAKVSPAREMVEVFKVSDPTGQPILTSELEIIAKHPGLQNYLVSKSYYRCHVWCGPLHAFEHGKLIIFPNTLLLFSLGSLAGILFLWLSSFFFLSGIYNTPLNYRSGYVDILSKYGFLRKIFVSRWPQTILMIIAMMLVYVVILTSVFGTKMSGRNLGVLLMWGVWLFLLISVMTPLLGRIWCTVCPLPLFGDYIQRRSLFEPLEGQKKEYRNKYYGLFLKWPVWLRNDWPKLFILLALTTFSATLVALPKITGFAAIALIVLPTVLAMIFEHRAFCRYLCPVSGFLGPFSRVSPFALRNKSQKICDRCKPHFCQKGSQNGWACPYGINTGEMKENTDCGLCFECLRSCLYNNVSVYSRPFGHELRTRNNSEAWLTIGVFTLALVYSILYQGHWPIVRDYVNILDKGNWGLFLIYTIIVWTLVLVVMPGIIYLLSLAGKKLSGMQYSAKNVFLTSAGALLPLGLMLWIAFVIPMLFVNVTFVIQSFSDPFGWGWDFFGTASIPWHQFLPRTVPWLQAILVLTGLYFSLRNLKKSWHPYEMNNLVLLKLVAPVGLFIFAFAFGMIIFFTN
jgi:polyferredoxin/heme/copper-type cytochrome/quinol oxidase subunit 2